MDFIFTSNEPVLACFVRSTSDGANEKCKVSSFEDFENAGISIDQVKAFLYSPKLHRLLWIPASLFWSKSLFPVSPLLSTASFSSLMSSGGGALPIASTLLFMFSLRSLNSIESASKGNILGILGTLAGIAPLLFLPGMSIPTFIITGAAATALGVVTAANCSFENLPELVAGFHSLTGLAAVCISFGSVLGLTEPLSTFHLIESFLGCSVGAFTFSSSVVCALRLNNWLQIANEEEWKGVRDICLSLSGLILLGLGVGMGNGSIELVNGLVGGLVLSLIDGALVTAVVNGSDLPVMISLLNAVSGIATSMSGFLLDSTVLVMSGGLITSSGYLLSKHMSHNMNKKLIDVVLNQKKTARTSPQNRPVSSIDNSLYSHEALTISVEETISSLARAKSVLIIPGYGMATSKCQHILKELVTKFGNSKTIHFGIHPVAGRLPGHMQVLLAEANIPYNLVKEMDEVNKLWDFYDLAVVIGANDIVNPATQSDADSPIFGMPAIEVWKAKSVVVLKRGLQKGYAGVENPLFYMKNVEMLFGDAKQTLSAVVEGINKLDLSKFNGKSFEIQFQPSNQEDMDIEIRASNLKALGISSYIGVCNETGLFEKRCGLSPKVVYKLRQLGFGVIMESGSGEAAGWSDSVFESYGAEISADLPGVLLRAGLIVKLSHSFSEEFLQNLNKLKDSPEKSSDIKLVCLSIPSESVQILANNPRLTAYNLQLVPRISRAQKLDTITSMANIAGYRAVIDAFKNLPRFSRTSITASGSIPPAVVFIMGAGVAGLSAIATAKGLGARVIATDVRPEVRDQVESMGAEFLDVENGTGGSSTGGTQQVYAKEVSGDFLKKQRECYTKILKESDVVICTAMVPNRKAPLLVTKEMVNQMKSDSVLIDLAAGTGGNCECTLVNEILEYTTGDKSIKIIGRTDYVSDMPQQASDLIANNFYSFIELVNGDKETGEEAEEDILVRSCLAIKDGQLVLPQQPPHANKIISPSKNTRPEQECESPVIAASSTIHDPSTALSLNPSASSFSLSHILMNEEILLSLTLGSLIAAGFTADPRQVKLMGDFLMSLMVGNFTVSNVSPSLHTPLISVTNAISGIIVVGGMQQMADTGKLIAGTAAVFFSLVNVTGGFTISHRMISMFNRKDEEEDERIKEIVD
jgi:NAD(P) transhydrogenase